MAAGQKVGDHWKIPMKPFSPLDTADQPSVTLSKRTLGPWFADYDAHGKNYSIRWTAKRIANDRPEGDTP